MPFEERNCQHAGLQFLEKDLFILQCIQGCKINFTSVPYQLTRPHQINFNNSQLKALSVLIDELIYDKMLEDVLLRKVITYYMYSVFLVAKKDSTPECPKYCLLLNINLKQKLC